MNLQHEDGNQLTPLPPRALPVWLGKEARRETMAAAAAALKVRRADLHCSDAAAFCLDILLETAEVVAVLAQLRDYSGYTFFHSLNVAVIAGQIGRELALGGDRLKNLILSGLLHDIGKQCVPLALLNKRGRLSAAEMTVIRRHAAYGYALLKKTLPQLDKEASLGVLQHHERLDGSGYPFALSGDGISLFARVIAIADSYDAMTGERIYRAKMSPAQALAVITADMAGRIDERIGRVFLDNVARRS